MHKLELGLLPVPPVKLEDWLHGAAADGVHYQVLQCLFTIVQAGEQLVAVESGRFGPDYGRARPPGWRGLLCLGKHLKGMACR